MERVKSILTRKGNRTLSVTPDTKVYDALALMSENNIGAVLILENEKLAGIFTERHYSRNVILEGRNSLDTQIKEVMTQKVVTVSPEDTIEECMELMTEKRIRHLPVVRGDRVIGIISIGDVVKHIIEEQESVIEHLKLFMSGV
ncbi:MAG: CBS domain-containing protein [Bacteroidota bacterium]|nr:CBS domain-containing protein [Flavisolibacter sp.]MDQ3843250.1 CBS domain-containing protein [Bacteroidota bacterium]MBD0286472.1 CBS domain-containing protein [Flavisolibacter sp.]MBD0350958.1 CBS domain-containing protein [Flavisolibacter sp.]MBD0365513.1 CBS domain-containing protein [Flavisolibacter sp.]